MGLKYVEELLELIMLKNISLQNSLWKLRKDLIVKNIDRQDLMDEAGENIVNILNNKKKIYKIIKNRRKSNKI